MIDVASGFVNGKRGRRGINAMNNFNEFYEIFNEMENRDSRLKLSNYRSKLRNEFNLIDQLLPTLEKKLLPNV